MKSCWIIGLLACAALVGSRGPQSAAASDAQEKAVIAAQERFYTALNALFGGDAGPMEDVWSHADDVTYMGPGGGMQVGWPAVSANWKCRRRRSSADKFARKKCGARRGPASPSSVA